MPIFFFVRIAGGRVERVLATFPLKGRPQRSVQTHAVSPGPSPAASDLKKFSNSNSKCKCNRRGGGGKRRYESGAMELFQRAL